MEWKFVFNTTVGDKWWSYIDNAKEFVKQSGYKFFTWNGSVYDLEGNDTGIKIEDLK